MLIDIARVFKRLAHRTLSDFVKRDSANPIVAVVAFFLFLGFRAVPELLRKMGGHGLAFAVRVGRKVDRVHAGSQLLQLGTTFSLPGMTTYSVSKWLSTSTPSVLLGRSFTCPYDASTVYPLPRYFEISLTLPGDSTMTKPFANGTSEI